MSKLTIQQVKNKLSSGRFFRVVFRKRTDNTIRSMVCRTGVKRYLARVGMAYDPDKHDLLAVYDVQRRAYRMVSLDDVKELHFDGQSHYFG